MPSYKLTYFNLRGVAETSRFLFAVAKVPYEDERFSISLGTPGDFSTVIRPEFDEAKASGKLDPSCGKVPLLYIDGAPIIGQSKAIERFLASEFGLMGANSIEKAQVDYCCETLRDMKDAYQKVKSTKDEAEREEAMKTYFDTTLPDSIATFAKSLPPAKGDWLVGDKVSLADLSFYLFLLAPKCFFDNAEGAKAAVSKCPRILKALEATGNIPEVKEWIEKRPDTMF